MNSNSSSSWQTSLQKGLGSVLTGILISMVFVSIPSSVHANPTFPLDLEQYSLSPTGQAWVDVPFDDRIYLMNRQMTENLPTTGDGDDVITYLPADASCTYQGAGSFSGPAMFWNNRDTTYSGDPNSRDCRDSSNNPVTNLTIPFGFDIDFGGEVHSGAYLIPAGALVFGSDFTYSASAAESAFNIENSGITAFGADLMAYTVENKPEESSYIWTAQTIIGGKQAFVAAWENMYQWSSRDGNAQFSDQPVSSFQIVILNDGNDNFTTWFNYERIDENIVGYSSPQTFLNFDAGQISTSQYRVYSDIGFTQDCLRTKNISGGPNREVNIDFYNSSGTVLQRDLGSGLTNIDEGNISGLSSLRFTGENSVNFFSDSLCADPISADVFDGARYAVVKLRNSSTDSVLAGWFIWNDTDPQNVIIQPTEFFPNRVDSDLHDAAPVGTRLISNSLNSNVPGRYIVGMSNGSTVGDPLLDVLLDQETVIGDPPPRSSRKAASLGSVSLDRAISSSGAAPYPSAGKLEIFKALKSRVLKAKPSSALSVLNEGTMPRTVFIPTDRAFVRLVQRITGEPKLSEGLALSYLSGLPLKRLESLLLRHKVTQTLGYGEAVLAKRVLASTSSGVEVKIYQGPKGVLRLSNSEEASKVQRPALLPALSNINLGNLQLAHMINRVMYSKQDLKLNRKAEMRMKKNRLN